MDLSPNSGHVVPPEDPNASVGESITLVIGFQLDSL